MRLLFLLGLTALIDCVAFLCLALKLGHPHHRTLALVVYLTSWIPFGLALWLQARSLAVPARLGRSLFATHGPYILATVALVGCGYLAWVLFPLEPSPLDGLPDNVVATETSSDLAKLGYLCHRTDETLRALETHSRVAGDVTRLQPTDRQRLKNTWADLIEITFELDLLKRRHQAFYRIDGINRPTLHARAFLVGYGAFVAQYRAGVLASMDLRAQPALLTLLNEEHGPAGIPAGSVTALQAHTVDPNTVIRLNAGRAYLALVRRRLEPEAALLKTVDGLLGDIDRVVETDPGVFAGNPLDVLERKAFGAWFPIQKGVALQMGRVRTATRPYFIGPEHVGRFADRLEPGDILLERREWHLTNLGIPGFWTHVALFVGTPEQLRAAFEGLVGPTGESIEAVIERDHSAVAEELGAPDPDGYRKVVIEALAPGVILTSLERTTNADSLAVLRPNVSQADKFKALLRAFTHLGKPYDYDFDFTTDNQLVCSELVYKAYQGASGFELTPKTLSGRLVLPPNELVAKFDLEHDAPSPDLELVLFLDGAPGPDGAEERDVEAFRTSWQRPKWHILVK